MKNFLVITGVAISLFASSAFAQETKALEAITKAKEVFTAPRVGEGRGAKVETRIDESSAKSETRGAKTIAAKSLEETAAEVERSRDENLEIGSTCGLANLEYVTLPQQAVLTESAEIGETMGKDCFGNGKIQDLGAIKNGIDTIAAATTEAKAQGASKALKVRLLDFKKKVKIAYKALVTFASATGRSVQEAKEDFVQVCRTCLDQEPSVCSAL